MKLIILITLITTQYLFALVSIVPVEIGAKPGVHGKAGVSLETKRGNTDKDNYKVSLRVAYDSNSSYVAWAEASGSYGKVNGKENTKKSYLHARYIHALSKKALRAEVFAQVQNDKYKLIHQRHLLGVGLRVRLFELFGNSKGYFGLGAFYEGIEYIDVVNNPTESHYRLNSYLAYTIKFSKKSTLTYVFYYQPIVDQMDDYVQLHNLELKLPIYKSLSLQLKVSYSNDTNPASGLEEYDLVQTTKFVYSF